MRRRRRRRRKEKRAATQGGSSGHVMRNHSVLHPLDLERLAALRPVPIDVVSVALRGSIGRLPLPFLDPCPLFSPFPVPQA
eukprot:2147032-Pyramimonas_sp.AAC.2